MPQSPTISQELKELESSLSAHSVPTGYVVPDGYFDGLAANILLRVKALDTGTAVAELEILSPLLAGLSKKMPYTVPGDYFASLDPSFAFADESDSATELKQLSPLLGGLSRKSPFNVPEGYFDQKVDIPEVQKPAPVIRMEPVRRKWYRYAVAASVTIIVALSATLWFGRGTSDKADPSKSYAWIEKNMKKVSTEDIGKFVELADPAASDIASAPSDIKSLLKNVSDKEIQDFLKDVPVDETEDEDILFN
ncbi:MAG: hypothetical protein DI535_02855 [Citrobacter freundii]|nr:MAG: hypothetical protein DI535_02855 [Citrobacter freundii]